MKGLEERVSELEKQNDSLYSDLRSLKAEIDLLMQGTTDSEQNQPEASETKLHYLTEVNEQMFQQNRRLRGYIEACIDNGEVPTHEAYYRVLREDE